MIWCLQRQSWVSFPDHLLVGWVSCGCPSQELDSPSEWSVTWLEFREHSQEGQDISNVLKGSHSTCVVQMTNLDLWNSQKQPCTMPCAVTVNLFQSQPHPPKHLEENTLGEWNTNKIPNALYVKIKLHYYTRDHLKKTGRIVFKNF